VRSKGRIWHQERGFAIDRFPLAIKTGLLTIGVFGPICISDVRTHLAKPCYRRCSSIPVVAVNPSGIQIIDIEETTPCLANRWVPWKPNFERAVESFKIGLDNGRSATWVKQII
jgi:hypothetical protein